MHHNCVIKMSFSWDKYRIYLPKKHWNSNNKRKTKLDSQDKKIIYPRPFYHPCCMITLLINPPFFFFFRFHSPSPTIFFPYLPAAPPGTGQLPTLWSLPSAAGTFIPPLTPRSSCTTRHLWWTGTRSSSVWRRRGASYPSLSSPSSTISTGKYKTHCEEYD